MRPAIATSRIVQSLVVLAEFLVRFSRQFFSFREPAEDLSLTLGEDLVDRFE